MKLAILQTALHWELADENRQHIAQELKGLEPVDLVILPEMFTTGFSMRAPALAETMTGPTLEWMQALAQDAQAVLCGSVIMMSERGYTNRLLWVSPLGDVQYYDKRHLFRMAQEHQHYSAGQEKLVTSLAGINCCPLICYDLRFLFFHATLAKNWTCWFMWRIGLPSAQPIGGHYSKRVQSKISAMWWASIDWASTAIRLLIRGIRWWWIFKVRS